MIQELHFVQLPLENNIYPGNDLTFLRLGELDWYECNDIFDDHKDKVEDEKTALKLEVFFWKNKDKIKPMTEPEKLDYSRFE